VTLDDVVVVVVVTADDDVVVIVVVMNGVTVSPAELVDRHRSYVDVALTSLSLLSKTLSGKFASSAETKVNKMTDLQRRVWAG